MKQSGSYGSFHFLSFIYKYLRIRYPHGRKNALYFQNTLSQGTPESLLNLNNINFSILLISQNAISL